MKIKTNKAVFPAGILQVMLIVLSLSSCLIVHSQIYLIPFVDGLQSPTCITTDSSYHFFVTQRTGTVAIIDSGGMINDQPFLDITGRVKSSAQEQGLLGIVLHPQFITNGYFYVNYTGVGDSTHISRFTRDPADPGKALPESELKLMTIYQPYQNHNGGDLQFGPDGFLYIGLGDGGDAGDPGNRAQNKSELLGKILRIDVNSGNPYAIPATNPFMNDPLARHEIWALGLRNPWRFSFDRQTGDLWIGDVGQATREEIDFQAAGSSGGENYGWRCYEGTLPYNTSGCQPPSSYVFPVHEYNHDSTPCWAVTGGYVYRGTAFQNMTGKYFFADYCKDSIWSLKNVSGTWVSKTEGVLTGNNFSTFGENPAGELYIAGLLSGKIYKIADTSVSSVTGMNTEKLISIFPVPVRDKLTIRMNAFPGPANIYISDPAGKIIFSSVTYLQEFFLDLSGFAPGMYFLSIRTSGYSTNKKLIKE